MKQRLFLQVYLTILAVLAVVIAGAGGAWRFAERTRAEHVIEAAAEFLDNRLPPATAPAAQQQHALEALHHHLRVDVALFAADGSLIAEAGRPMPYGMMRRAAPAAAMSGAAMPAPAQPAPPSPGLAGPAARLAWTVPLADGRWFTARPPPPPWRPGMALLAFAAALGIAVAAGAWPVARSLTRRLERLQAGVEQLGTGDLTARVAVEGGDEVGALAASFNRAAGRIEELVGAHRLLLANASHELRTPLARIRMALELMQDGIDPARRAALRGDIAELDQLIGEILLASRLDAAPGAVHDEAVDLLALAAEEAARDGIAVDGTPVSVRGEPALLRRMIRNLIENARRHAGDRAPEISVRRTDGQAELAVRDHGPGVPAAEREKIFAPFYRIAGSAESGRGSGLGLALVRQIAVRHGGAATCEATTGEVTTGEAPGSGTLFRVRLPALDGNGAAL